MEIIIIAALILYIMEEVAGLTTAMVLLRIVQMDHVPASMGYAPQPVVPVNVEPLAVLIAALVP
jgi:hypothetical protein